MAGLYLLVGCMDCLHLLNMVIDDLSLWKEFPSVKGCTDCAFSRGGQCFAAATGNVIHVISTYTGQIIGHLRGHTNKVNLSTSLFCHLDLCLIFVWKPIWSVHSRTLSNLVWPVWWTIYFVKWKVFVVLTRCEAFGGHMMTSA